MPCILTCKLRVRLIASSRELILHQSKATACAVIRTLGRRSNQNRFIGIVNNKTTPCGGYVLLIVQGKQKWRGRDRDKDKRKKLLNLLDSEDAVDFLEVVASYLEALVRLRDELRTLPRYQKTGDVQA